MIVSDRPQWAALPSSLITIAAIMLAVADLQASASMIGPVALDRTTYGSARC
jgi:hypothetical protein